MENSTMHPNTMQDGEITDLKMMDINPALPPSSGPPPDAPPPRSTRRRTSRSSERRRSSAHPAVGRAVRACGVGLLRGPHRPVLKSWPLLFPKLDMHPSPFV